MPLLKRYPISQFIPLSENDLALVWQWRNQPHIRANMHNDAIISWQEHQAWFSQLQQDSNRQFFVFYQDNRPIGVLNFKQHSTGTKEWGCYLGETDVWPGSGLLLEIAALDYAAKHAQHSLYAEVLSFNHNVIKMHLLFGYHPLPDGLPLRRNNEPYTIKSFKYPLADWLKNRGKILAKLPKQIVAAANLIEFKQE